MRNHSGTLRKAIILVCTILPLISLRTALAQELSQPISLIVEQQNPHDQISFMLDQIVTYKTIDSKKFMSGHLREVTDSTISIEDKELKMVKIRHRELTAFKLASSQLVIDLQRPKTNYNLQHVFIKLKSGKGVSGKLVSAKDDSLVMQTGIKKPLRSISYADIESVGMHRKGSGGIGALIGGIGGGGIGAIIGVGSRPDRNTSVYSNDFGVGLSAVAGFLIGLPLGAAIGSANKQYLIQGDREKFHLFTQKINEKKWILRASKELAKK